MTLNTRRGLIAVVAWLGLSLSAACKSPSGNPPAPERPRATRALEAAAAVPTPPAFEPGDVQRGKALVQEFECSRCHSGTGTAAAKLDQDCVGCHEQIATDKFQATSSKLAKWKPHVMPYRDVPSLTDAGARLRPAWIRDYLLHPHDLRPSLAQTMPRLSLSPAQATDIATYLTSAAPAPSGLQVSAQPAQVAHGKELLNQRGCAGCHRFTGAGLADPPKSEALARTLGLAPDLRFARERAEPAAIARWLLDPTKVKRDSAMPNLGLSADDARDLAAFLSFGELEAAPAAPAFERLPVLGRRVGFDEVNQQVFSVTCRHCHTNPDSAGGDGGPGNTGGFGFKPRKIDFSSYQGIQSGGVDALGVRVSLFSPTSEGLPLLVAALIERVREDSGAPEHNVGAAAQAETEEAALAPQPRGMPLGLPPLTREQIQLVESWVAQGRPL